MRSSGGEAPAGIEVPDVSVLSNYRYARSKWGGEARKVGRQAWKLIYHLSPLRTADELLLRRLLGLETDGSVSLDPRLTGVKGSGFVGSGSSLHNAFIDARGGVRIGHDVMFGNEVMVLTAGHPCEGSVPERRKIIYSPVDIGDGVWVGSRAIILGGVSIGEMSVVGAGAVVSRSIPPGVLAAGVPARPIKQLRP